ncbi:MAG TPA: adenylate/guanylate cyclase domain-containing protein [Acidimicrobiales bacterium]|nr:adenylate/guanylate cyclase domain-containing protein [Acidimicrobiales bacterium]
MSDEPNLPAQRKPSRPLPAVSDDQREKVIDELRKHCGAGALTLDDFAKRAGDVWAASTSMELDAIVADLPDLASPTTEPQIVGQATRRKIRRWMPAIMSGSHKEGRWRVGDQLNAIAIMGGVDIDLREAEFDSPELHITAVAIMGGISIIVPEGIDVDLGGLAIMGGKDARLAPVPLIPGAPRVRVTAFCLMGGVDVKSKKPAAVLRAARAAKRALEKERRDQRRLESRERQLDRERRRLDRSREARSVGQQVRREVHDIIRTTIQDSMESMGTPPGRPARPTRPARPDRFVTNEDDAGAVRRRLKRNGRPEGTVTIVFTDIESSTEMIERLGDGDASVLVKEHNDIVRAQVAECGGYEVKFRGDGFMLAFTSAAKGVRCALAIQEAMKDFSERHPEAPFSINIGINSGEAVPDGDDFLGTAVNIAARLADTASGGEVLVTSVVRDLVASSGEFKFLPEQQLALKGISEPQRVCQVAW